MKRDGAVGANEPVSVNVKNISGVPLALVVSSTRRCQVTIGLSKHSRITFTEYLCFIRPGEAPVQRLPVGQTVEYVILLVPVLSTIVIDT